MKGPTSLLTSAHTVGDRLPFRRDGRGKEAVEGANLAAPGTPDPAKARYHDGRNKRKRKPWGQCCRDLCSPSPSFYQSEKSQGRVDNVFGFFGGEALVRISQSAHPAPRVLQPDRVPGPI